MVFTVCGYFSKINVFRFFYSDQVENSIGSDPCPNCLQGYKQKTLPNESAINVSTYDWWRALFKLSHSECRTKHPWTKHPMPFLTPRTKHPTSICHPRQNIPCSFCHPGQIIPCHFCHAGQNIPCHFCHPGQNVPHSV